jgi:Spy/CpxP family protein refolding chaperone
MYSRAARFALPLLATALLAAPTAADDRHPHRGPRRPAFEEVLERNAERLGLDAIALAEIRGIAEASRAETEALAERVHERRRELRALLDVDAPDLDALMRQVERVGEAEIALDKRRLTTLVEIRARLTPEQRQELVRIHAERKREHHGSSAPPTR